jgi:hypothetical protein
MNYIMDQPAAISQIETIFVCLFWSILGFKPTQPCETIQT